jgi:hypothetical protein
MKASMLLQPKLLVRSLVDTGVRLYCSLRDNVQGAGSTGQYVIETMNSTAGDKQNGGDDAAAPQQGEATVHKHTA